MPVIRGKQTATALEPAKRAALLGLLTQERASATLDGPVIFEIPLEQPDRMDVMVIWDLWEGIRSEDRTDLILEAYQDEKERIALALGVTQQEALQQQLLPYAVVPMVRRGEVDAAQLRQAMLEEGAIALSPEKVALRLPTMAMAQAAHQRLCDKLPKGYWSIVQSPAEFSPNGA
jgi:hypothetical protein